MTPGGYNIKTILQALYAAVDGVAEARYITERPNATSTPTDTFVVVAAPVRIYDHLAYGSTTCRISLYARDMVSTNRGRQEDGNALGAMLERVYAVLPIVTDNYTFTLQSVVDDGSDDIGFHVWHVLLKLTIKK